MIPDLSECPFCKTAEEDKTGNGFISCRKCGIIFNRNYSSLSYDREYFISEYKDQYGKTYIEDYKNIYSLALKRLKRIFRFHEKSNPESLLDIGSAAGFFLKAAEDLGVKKLQGIEISEYASSFCVDQFSIPVINLPFDQAAIEGRFDIISAWFFLEHCRDPEAVLMRIYSLLNEGGVLAMAMPSWFGPLFMFSREKWIETHPADHRFDISPGGAKKILKQAGFRKVKVYSCGFHPERIVKRNSLFFRPFSFLYRQFTSATAFSDTIEIYAVK